MANSDTLVPNIIWNIPSLGRTDTYIRLCNIIKKTKTTEYPESLKNIVPSLTLSRAITGVDIREEKNLKGGQTYQIFDHNYKGNRSQRANNNPVKMVQNKQHHKPNQNCNFYDEILLYSGSTIKVTLMNTNRVTNIKPKKIPYTCLPMQAQIKWLWKATLKIGDVPYGPTKMDNIFGLSHLAEKHRITYNGWGKNHYWYTPTMEFIKFN